VPFKRLVIKMKVALYDVANDFEFRIAWKRHFTAEHDIQHNTKRPNVDFRTVVLKEDFRSNVIWLQITIEHLPSHSLWTWTPNL
jgi:hypothetical protein